MIRNTKMLADIGETCLRHEIEAAVDDLAKSLKVLKHFQDAEKTSSRLSDCEIMFGLVIGNARRYLSCKSQMFQAGLDVQEYESVVTESTRGLKEDIVYLYGARYCEEGIVDTIKKFYLGSIV